MGIPDGCRIAPIGLPTTLNATDARAPLVGVPAISVSSPMSIRDAPKNGLRTGESCPLSMKTSTPRFSSWRPTAVTATRAPSVMNAWHRSKPAFFVGMSTNCNPRKHALTTWPGPRSCDGSIGAHRAANSPTAQSSTAMHSSSASGWACGLNFWGLRALCHAVEPPRSAASINAARAAMPVSALYAHSATTQIELAYAAVARCSTERFALNGMASAALCVHHGSGAARCEPAACKTLARHHCTHFSDKQASYSTGMAPVFCVCFDRSAPRESINHTPRGPAAG